MKEMLKKALSLVLVACMVLGVCGNGLIVLATDAGDEKTEINLVSYGDSMTNGFGLFGYDSPGSQNGYLDYGVNSYANQLAAWLAGCDMSTVTDNQTVFTGTNGTVNHTQLATSAMRVEDLLFALSYDWENANYSFDVTREEFDALGIGDYYTWNEFVDGRYGSNLTGWDEYSLAYYCTACEKTYTGWGYSSKADGNVDDVCVHVKAGPSGKVNPNAVEDADTLSWLWGANSLETFGRADERVPEYKYIIPYSGSNDSEGAKANEWGSIWFGNGTAATAAQFQNATAEADIITIGAGNANFGVFLLARMISAMGVLQGFGASDYCVAEDGSWVYDISNYDYDKLLETIDDPAILDIAVQAETLVREYIGLEEEGETQMDALVNIMLFATVSYLVNYRNVLDRIAELNPDAEVMIVGIMNTFSGMSMDMGNGEVVNLEELFEAVFGLVNDYLAGLATVLQFADEDHKDMTYYFAAQPTVEVLVDVFEENIDGNNVLRDRFIEEITFRVFYMMSGALPEMPGGIALTSDITREQVEAYMAGNVENLTPAEHFSCAAYTAFERAIIAGSRDGILYLSAIEETSHGFGGVFGPIADALGSGLVDTDQVMADVTAEIGAWATDAANADKIGGIAALLAGYGISDMNTVAQVAFAVYVCGLDLTSVAPADMVDAVTDAITGYATNKYASAQILANIEGALYSAMMDSEDKVFPTLLAMFGRMVIGNGLGQHPSSKGHDDLAEAVIAAYDGKYTASEETVKNAELAAGMLLDYLQKNGYIDAAKDELINVYILGFGQEIDAILNENLGSVVKNLKLDLAALYAELEAQTLALNAKLEELTNEELAVLADMQAERDALAAELAALEAKLEAVKAGQNITRTGADVEEFAAELEAAIAETEAAIAALDASIAALNARIEADLEGVASIQAAIAEIKAEILDTQAALAEVEAAIAQLNADLEVLYDATLVLGEAVNGLYDLTLGHVDVKAVVNAAKDLIEVLPSIVENLETVYNETLTAIAKAQAAAEAVKEFAANIEDEVAAIVSGAETLVGIEAEKLEAIKATAAACAEAVDAFVAENQPALEAALKATYEDLQVLADEKITKIEIWWEKNETKVMTAVGIAYWYCQEKGYIDEAKELALEYAELVKGYVADLKVELEEAEKWLEENLPTAEKELNDRLADLVDELHKIEAELLDAVDAETRAALEAAKAAVEAKIEAVNAKLAELKALVESVKEYIASVKAAIEEVEESLDNVIVAAQAVGADLVALWNALCNLKCQLCELTDAVVGLHDAVVEEIKILVGLTTVVVEDFIAVLESLPVYVELLKSAAELVTDVENWEALAELLGSYGLDIEGLKALFESATHADYEVNKDSYYVAIGDGSAVSASYVDLLAKELGLGERYSNLAQEGLTVDQAFAVISAEAAELAKADLVTVGFNNVAATSNLFNTFAGLDSVDTNWSDLIGAEYSAYVVEALAEVEAMLMDEGLDAATAALVVDAVDAYAYTYAAREFKYPELVNEIHAINPDALVVIVGTYNDLASAKLTIGDTEIVIGEYVQYLVAAANLQNLVYALLTENTIYVDAPAVETLFEEALANGELKDVGPQTYIAALMIGYMNPSEDGHEYIKDQILDALNVTRKGLLGDVDGDWDVDNVDAMLILQYDALLLTKEELDLTVGDVDGDGDVDNVDAMLVLQYDAELIEAFPAEN